MSSYYSCCSACVLQAALRGSIKEKLSFAPMERAAAANACYFAIMRRRRGSNPGKFVSCLAIGTIKGGWL
jgi:hypothetical protein